MTIEPRPLNNGAFGFPRGRARRVRPVALACLHITGNASTARMTDYRAAAMAERNYANRPQSPGPSAHDYIARDGLIIRAIDPASFAAWSNGDVNAPHTANPGVAKAVAFRSKGYNVNEAYWLEIEAVGFGSHYPITTQQRDAIAHELATWSKRTGLPVSRLTVHGHWEINGVDRRNCPAQYPLREGFLADVISRAHAILSASRWVVAIRPAPGKTYAYFFRYTLDANGNITGRTRTRTKGFSARSSAPDTKHWSGVGDRKLVEIIDPASSRYRQWVDDSLAHREG